VTIPVNGMVNNSWNCTLAQNGSEATVSGASYNATIAPGASASFGFCVVF
jgi:endoglucanase